MYAASKGEVNIHFTVSHEHLPLFQAHLAENKATYEEKLGVKFHISYSEQKPSTDTLAANPDGTPFRTADGKLLFRPGGHGALIENLNEQEAAKVIKALSPKLAVPCHFWNFAEHFGSPAEFMKQAADICPDASYTLMRQGEVMVI